MKEHSGAQPHHTWLQALLGSVCCSPAVLASGECHLLPRGNHLPILHLLHDRAHLAGGCHHCQGKGDNYSLQEGEKFLKTLSGIAHSSRASGNSTREWEMLL